MLEPSDVKRFTRELNFMLKRAGEDDPEAFAIIVGLVDDARARLSTSAETMREAGYSWQDIARPLGVTRSAAFQRFGSPKARDAAKSVEATEPMFDETGLAIGGIVSGPSSAVLAAGCVESVR